VQEAKESICQVPAF